MRTTVWLTMLALTLGLVTFAPAQEAKQEKKAAQPKQKLVEPKAPAKKAPPERPTPTVANYEYGKDSVRQKFDFWQAKSDKPTPVVLLIHGGGWKGGDKSSYGTNMTRPWSRRSFRR
jgi:acetyl esterase/lipase